MAENSKIEWTDHTFNPWRGKRRNRSPPSDAASLTTGAKAMARSQTKSGLSREAKYLVRKTLDDAYAKVDRDERDNERQAIVSGTNPYASHNAHWFAAKRSLLVQLREDFGLV